MAKMEFKKQDRNQLKQTKPVEETVISRPSKTFDIKDMEKNETNKNPVGRPRKNKKYGTVRLQKNNVNRINSIQNSLGYITQDDLISALLDKAERELSNEQKIMFEMYMKTYQNRSSKHP
ncbi:replication-associated protein RepC [Companilactobacillus crustorum]|jgi:hypothetical protein|uniref:Replication-associated protein RepC n=3 Tax=Companilactobacillus TaxID=2767879 RepID=A0A837RGA3_9LACO|nr:MULTISPECIES: hypothetical protein [Lactobacillaceae]MCG0733709.1 replication-associated protein RepC [Lactiplantibacillus plantarum]ANK61045.1 hypothetical protein AYR52_12000 [Loigolactobacillus backii]ANK68563.1 hypothetical protein AYR55_12460 [Loigolactobacillus backii]KRK40945.1 hypothetical protein FD26_GL001905 [Companilactobacillus crustorum JCM 15951]KRO17331.1 hypothetical protein IV63_GL001941 [Companilactobacillus crustorum]